MTQMARKATRAEWGVLEPGQYLIHDRHGKSCPAFQGIVDAAGITRVRLPPRSPNLNAYADRWVRSVKDDVLSRLILVGEPSLRYAIQQYETHDHEERRPHQGKGHVMLMPRATPCQGRDHPIQCRGGLGGLLNYDDREAA